MNHTYPKTEKLKRKKYIDLLFSEGRTVTKYPLRLVYVPVKDLDVPLQMGVSVSKRYFKKAVHRNRIKRLLREVYRLNKAQFLEKFGENSLTMLFYVSPTLPKKYQEIEEEFLKLLKK